LARRTDAQEEVVPLALDGKVDRVCEDVSEIKARVAQIETSLADVQVQVAEHLCALRTRGRKVR
jgi:hypothetical protein